VRTDAHSDPQSNVWFAPGTSCWRSLTGRTFERRQNMRNTIALASQYRAEGILLTAWGDLGHRQQWPITRYALAESAAAMWSGSPRFDDNLADAISLQVFGDRTLEAGRWLAELGDADLPLREIAGRPDADGDQTRLKNATALFEEVSPARPRDDRPGTIEHWRDTRAKLESLATRVPRGVDAQVRDELAHTVDRAVLACDIALWRRGDGGEMGELVERVESIMAEHARLWRERSRPGGLSRSLSHDQGLIEALKTEAVGAAVS